MRFIKKHWSKLYLALILYYSTVQFVYAFINPDQTQMEVFLHSFKSLMLNFKP